MKSPAKIQLSKQEIDLVNNTQWILSKHIIIKKVFEMFGELSKNIGSIIDPYKYLFPENIKYQDGKITRGENYQLLPYLILDYPSFFWKDRVVAIRSMFWWGNFFSITLHLSGVYKKKFITNNVAVLSFLQKNNFFICVNKNEWQHHFETDNYLPASAIDLIQFEKINKNNFFKASKKIPLGEWENANEFLLNSFVEIIQLLQINYPACKKDL